jgi:hypothetical protein
MAREPGWKRMNLNVETSLTFHGPKGAVLPPTRCARNQHSRGRLCHTGMAARGPVRLLRLHSVAQGQALRRDEGERSLSLLRAINGRFFHRFSILFS